MSQVWEWITGGIKHLLSGLAAIVPGMVAKVLSAFGVTMITLKGVLPTLKSYLLQFVSGLPADVMNFLGALGLGVAFSMIFSALVVRMATKIFFVPTAVAEQLKAGGVPV